MKRRIIIVVALICVGVVFIIQFSSKRNIKLKEELVTLYGTELKLPIEKMRCMINGKDTLLSETSKCKFKVVLYVDSANCSSCAYKNLWRWKEFKEEMDKKKKKVQIVFIMNPSETNKKSLYEAMKQSTVFDEPIYVDTLGIFNSANPLLPSESLFHCFLLDAENKILLVGNPVTNKRMRELYLNDIKKQGNAEPLNSKQN